MKAKDVLEILQIHRSTLYNYCLTRFGFGMLEQFFKYFGTSILVLNDSLDNKSYEQDLIAIMHYFTTKSYSHRKKLNKLRKELEKLD